MASFSANMIEEEGPDSSQAEDYFANPAQNKSIITRKLASVVQISTQYSAKSQMMQIKLSNH